MVDDAQRIIDEVIVGLRKKCWYVSCGGAAGRTFQLAMGEKVRRTIPLRNPAATEEFRVYEGASNLLVWCSWRLDSSVAPLTSSDDTTEHVVDTLRGLIGRTVENVRVDVPGWDLHLQFTGGLTLHVFCDHLPGDPSFDGNWDLSLTDKMIAVGVGSNVVVEARSP
jgi:hypothetical protein